MAIPHSYPVAHAPAVERVAYLRRVLGITMLGLGLAGITGSLSAVALAFMPALMTGYAPMLIILGMWAVSNYVARPMVFGTARWAGFLLGTAAQGVAMGFLLLAAVVVSATVLGNAFMLIFLALGLTFFSGVGMTAYVWTVKRDFSLIGAGLSALGIPMLILMAVSFAFPAFFGGTLGLVLAAVFVVVSAAGLVYQLNEVVHTYRTDMDVEGGYTITMGLLVLFWNILSLLMRLTRR